MRKFILVSSLLLGVFAASAQSAEDSVKTTVNALFAAMRASDGEGVRRCFADSAVLQTITRTGSIRSEQVQAFAAQVSTLKKDSADERIAFDVVKVDGALATVWTPYQFYYAGKFSHCGVNSFQLVRLDGRWKIQYLIDTRRRAGCQ